MILSKSSLAVIEAYDKGYRVTEQGEVVNPEGQPRAAVKKRFAENDYAIYRFNIKSGGKCRPVPVHRLQAYQKFGDRMFERNMVVRHLNGNPLDNSADNIAIGTQSDNCLDRTPEARMAHAVHAASHLVKYDWDAVEKDHAEGIGFTKLAKKYGMSKGTLSHHFNRIKDWRRLNG